MAFVKKLVREFIGVDSRQFLFGRNGRLAVLVLCPGESRWNAVHIAQDVVEFEVAIGNCSIGSREVDSVVWRCVDGDVFERDIAERLIADGPDVHRMTT